MRTTMAIVVLAALVSAVAPAQEAKLAFEVASVKRNISGEPGFGGPTATSGDRPTGFSATNVTLPILIRRAYGFEVGTPFDPMRYLVGGPGWVGTSRFDITATAGREVTRTEVSAMLRTLLEQRFKLVVAVEQRLRDAYTLRLARADGRLGPDIRKAADDCAANRRDPLAAAKAMLRPSSGALPSSGSSCAPIESVAGMVGMVLNATVIDETGLTGRWDFVIAHMGLQSGTKPMRNGTLGEYPSIFSAVEEQLGLKLDRRREMAPYDVLVIKSVDQPSEN